MDCRVQSRELREIEPGFVAAQVTELENNMSLLIESLCKQTLLQEKKRVEDERAEGSRSPITIAHRALRKHSTFLQQLLPIRKKAEEAIVRSEKTGLVLPRVRNPTLRPQRCKQRVDQLDEKRGIKEPWEVALTDITVYSALEDVFKKLNSMPWAKSLDEQHQSLLENCVEKLILYGMTDYEAVDEHITLKRVVDRLPLKDSRKEELKRQITKKCEEKIKQRGEIRVVASLSPRCEAEREVEREVEEIHHLEISDQPEGGLEAEVKEKEKTAVEHNEKEKERNNDNDQSCPSSIYNRLAVRILYTLYPPGNLTENQIINLGAWSSVSFIEDSALLGKRWSSFEVDFEKTNSDKSYLIDLISTALDDDSLDLEQRKRLLLLTISWAKRLRGKLCFEEGFTKEKLDKIIEYLKKIGGSALFFKKYFDDEVRQYENLISFSRRSLLLSFSDQSSLSSLSLFPSLVEKIEKKKPGTAEGLDIVTLSIDKTNSSYECYEKLRGAVVASFVSIPRAELISLLAETEKPGPCFSCFIQLWDRISGCVYLELIVEKKTERKSAYTLFLETACKSYEDKDFFTSSAIFLCLQQKEIEEQYGEYKKEFSGKIELLSSVFSPIDNWKKLADLISKYEKEDQSYIPPPFLLPRHAASIRYQINEGLPILFRAIGRCFDRETPLKIVSQFENCQKQIRAIHPTSVADFIYLQEVSKLPMLCELQKRVT